MIQQSHSWHISGQNYNSERYMHPYVHSSTIHNSQDMETTWKSIDRWMDEEGLVHIYVTKYYSAIKRNEIMPFATTWMNLEIIILSEVSQKEKNTIWYHLRVESKIWHQWIYLWINRNRLTDIENRFVVAKAEGVG